MAWWMVPAGLSIANNIMNRNAAKKQPPQFNYQPQQTAPSYQAMPQAPQMQAAQRSAMPQFQQTARAPLPQMQAPAAQQTPVYNQLTNQLTAGQNFLPDNYRQAVMGQVQREFGQFRDQDRARVMEEANKYNLLNSGSLGVQLGMVEDNYSKQIGNAMDSLTQQEFAARQNAIQQALGMESQGRGFDQRNLEQGRDFDFRGAEQLRGFEQRDAEQLRDFGFQGSTQARGFEQRDAEQMRDLAQRTFGLQLENDWRNRELDYRSREAEAQRAFEVQRMNYLAQVDQADKKDRNRQATMANLMQIPYWMQAAGMG